MHRPTAYAAAFRIFVAATLLTGLTSSTESIEFDPTSDSTPPVFDAPSVLPGKYAIDLAAGLDITFSATDNLSHPDQIHYSIFGFKGAQPVTLLKFCGGPNSGSCTIHLDSPGVWKIIAYADDGNGVRSPKVTFDNVNVWPDGGIGHCERTYATYNIRDSALPEPPPVTPPESMPPLSSMTIPSGIVLDGIAFGVSLHAPLVLRFEGSVTPEMMEGVVTLVKDGVTAESASLSYPDSKTVHILPTSHEWSPNSHYVIGDGIVHIAGRSPRKASLPSLAFVTQPDSAADFTMVSPLDHARVAPVQVPVGALPPGGFVVPRVRFINPTNPLTAPANALTIDSQGILQVLAKAEVDIFREPNGAPASANAPIILTLATPVLKAALAARLDKTTWGIYRWGPQGGFIPVPNAVVNSNGTVSAPITASGMYYLAAAAPSALSGAHAFPNPFKTALGHNTITFSGLAADSTIKIFTILGEPIITLHGDSAGSDLPWLVRNADGEAVASGVYVYRITNASGERSGKLVIVR